MHPREVIDSLYHYGHSAKDRWYEGDDSGVNLSYKAIGLDVSNSVKTGSSGGALIVCKTSSVLNAGSLPVTLKFGDSVLELDDRFVYTQDPVISDVRPLAAFHRYIVAQKLANGRFYAGPRGSGAPPSPRNIKCTRMHHFQKKNSEIFSPAGPHKNVWGPTRMFSRAPLWLSTGLLLCYF